MPRFVAELVDAGGVVRTEVLEATDRAAALEALGGARRAGLRRLAPEEPPGARGAGEVLDEVAVVASELTRLLGRGLPLAAALREVAPAARRAAVGRDLSQAADAAEEGGDLAGALAHGESALASPLVVGLVRAGERAGRLPALLAEVSAVAARVAATRRRVLGALHYPLLLVAFAALVVAATATAGGPAADVALRLRAAHGEGAPVLLRWAAAAAAAPEVTWGAVGAVLALLVAGRALVGWAVTGAALRGRGPFFVGRTPRDALLFQSLAALLRQELPLDAAWAVARGSLRGDGAAAADLAEGGSLTAALGAVGAVTPGEAAVLDAAQAAGPAALGGELERLAAARLDRFERSAQAWARGLEVALEVGLGLAVLAVGIHLFPSAARPL